ncbi:SGNH/GDSL hydrolase family protein [Paenibacillus sp. HB172176]|uniref:SGNH/GDSL hydrolase family protein n=1 Tax=Paenibacillus sp. HB172176 TaxID=2493690 RepID=UPI00143AC69A|nr:SGNH/GDSL hydrolase family protein [Paenibacillus sp. HB172176]
MSGQEDLQVLETRLCELMQPFWKSRVMHDESVIAVAEKGKPGSARLLFRPERILSVRSYARDVEYREGVDWVAEDGMLLFPTGSRIERLTRNGLYPPEEMEKATVPKAGGGYLLSNKQSIHQHQLAVSYVHSGTEWRGPVPGFAGNRLRNTVEKLRTGRPVTICLYGDSISAGYDSSGILNLPPYLPNWGRMLAGELRRVYRTDVELHNPSVGGKSADWGLANARELVAVHQPDLTILAFGMNDGTGRVPPVDFRQRIEGIMKLIRVEHPLAEFILAAPMLPNPLAMLPKDPSISFLGEQRSYRAELERLGTQQDAVMMDMTSVHEELLRHKPYWDMTGNHINHPNDFLSRWYAQTAAGLLIEDASVCANQID